MVLISHVKQDLCQVTSECLLILLSRSLPIFIGVLTSLDLVDSIKMELLSDETKMVTQSFKSLLPEPL